MYRLLFSIYYPHIQKRQLAKYGLKPLFEQLGVESFTYFFSLYKGENITIQIACSKKDITKRRITAHFEDFFSLYRTNQVEVRLPINQLFLDFPYNTLHFWDHFPFKSETLQLEASESTRMTSLSNLCLSKLVSEDRWDDASTFQIFIDLFSVLKVLLEQKFGKDIISVFTELIAELKKRSGSQEYIIERFVTQGKGIYKQNQSEIDAYFHTTKLQIEGNSQLQEEWINDWMEIINVHPQLIVDDSDFRKVSKVIRELILDVSSKIDLSQKGLVQALSLVSEMINKGDNYE